MPIVRRSVSGHTSKIQRQVRGQKADARILSFPFNASPILSEYTQHAVELSLQILVDTPDVTLTSTSQHLVVFSSYQRIHGLWVPVI
jgi:hypothetical protein